jgi:hypothetical protein
LEWFQYSFAALDGFAAAKTLAQRDLRQGLRHVLNISRSSLVMAASPCAVHFRDCLVNERHTTQRLAVIRD